MKDFIAAWDRVLRIAAAFQLGIVAGALIAWHGAWVLQLGIAALLALEALAFWICLPLIHPAGTERVRPADERGSS